MKKLNIKTQELISDISLLLIAVIWGSTFIIIKQTIENIPTFAFLSIRFGVASLLLLILCFKRIRNINSELLKDGTKLGIILFLVFAFQTVGLKYTPASVTAFITGMYVIIVPLFSAIMLRQKPNTASIFGVLISCAGLSLITLNNSIAISKGEFLVFMNAIFCSLHIIFTDTYSRKHDVVLLTTIQISVVFVLSTICSLAFEPYTLPRNPNTQLIFTIVLTGVFATVIAFLVQTGMQKYTTPTKAALIYTMEPVASVFFSYVIGGEILSMRQYSGAALIICAMMVAELGSLLTRDHALETL